MSSGRQLTASIMMALLDMHINLSGKIFWYDDERYHPSACARLGNSIITVRAYAQSPSITSNAPPRTKNTPLKGASVAPTSLR